MRIGFTSQLKIGLLLGMFLSSMDGFATNYETQLRTIRQALEKREYQGKLAMLEAIDSARLHPMERAEYLFCRGKIATRNKQPQLGRDYYQQALSQFEMVENISLYADTYYNLAKYHFYRNEYDSVQYCTDQLLTIKDIDHYERVTKKVIDAYNILGILHKRNGDFGQSTYYYELGLKECERYSLEDANKLYQNLSNLYIEKTNYLKAAEYLFRGVRLNERLMDSVGLAYNYENLAVLYIRQNNIPTAIQMLDLADAYVCPFIAEYPAVYNGIIRNQGLCQLYLNNDEIALAYFLQNATYHTATTDAYMLIEHYFNLARVYARLEQMDLAKMYLRKARPIFEQKRFNYYWADYYLLLGQTYFLEKDYQSAIANFELSLEKRDIFDNDYVSLKGANNRLALAYQQLGNYQLATEYALQAVVYADSIQQEINPKDLRSFFLELENEKKQLVLEEQRKAAELLAERRGRTNVLLVIALLLTACGVYLLIRLLNYRKSFAQRLKNEVREKTQELVASQQALQNTHQELKLFYAAIAHDLRYPILYAKHNLSELTNLATREQQQMVKSSEIALDNIQESFVRLLDFFHLEKEPLRKTTINLNDLLRDIEIELREIQVINRLTIVVEELPAVTADILLIRMVFVNLLANAEKFTQSTAEPVLRISGYHTDDKFKLRFADNGSGIQPKLKQSLFNSFVSGNSSDRTGLGIGLFMVKRIMERHGGQAQVIPQSVSGSMFELSLPDAPT